MSNIENKSQKILLQELLPTQFKLIFVIQRHDSFIFFLEALFKNT